MSLTKKNTYLSPRDTQNPAQFPSISQPKIIGSFSINENREYVPDTRNCQYVYKNYKSNHIHYDLNEGIENVKRKPESCSDEKLTHLLEFIVRNKHKLRKPNSDVENGVLSVDLVCFRGLLRLIMCTPYEYRDAWIILATKYKGTIYLCALDTEDQVKERLNRTDASKRILSYGFKFEQFILTDDPDKQPSTDVPVNECEEFCCIYSTTLNGQRLLYGAEMDGIECQHACDLSKTDLNSLNFVELKVKIREQHHRQKQNYYRFKLRNWWCQSFLVNIKKIIVGTRTPEGTVNEISVVNVKDIPKQCQHLWSSSLCMEFCSKFLKLIAKEMEGVDSPFDVYRFDYDPNKSEHIYLSSFTNKNQFSFLPEWFIEEIKSLAEQ